MFPDMGCLRRGVFFPLLMVLFSGSAPARDIPEFMIFTYGVDLNEKSVKALAASDFNIVYGGVDKLDLCKKYGIKLMIPRPGLDAAEHFRNDPSIWGYDIMDEPISLKQVRTAADSVKAYREADPTHPTFVNLNQKGGRWIRHLIETVSPDFLSYDDYPWVYGGLYTWFTGEDVMYVKLEQHRDDAMLANLPLTKWCEVKARWVPDGPNRTPMTPRESERKIRLNVYSSLAYGVKGILWFSGGFLFDKQTGEMNEDGKQVAGINHELKLLGPVLLPLRTTGVFHTAPVPPGSRKTTPDHWVQLQEKNLLMGTFRDNDNREYVMVVNKDWKTARKATMQFRLFLQEVQSVEMFDKHSGEWKNIQLTSVKDTRNPGYIYSYKNIPRAIQNDINFNDKDLPPEGLRFFEIYHTYPPPYQEISITLAPGDGELFRVAIQDSEDIQDPRETGHGF